VVSQVQDQHRLGGGVVGEQRGQERVPADLAGRLGVLPEAAEPEGERLAGAGQSGRVGHGGQLDGLGEGEPDGEGGQGGRGGAAQRGRESVGEQLAQLLLEGLARRHGGLLRVGADQAPPRSQDAGQVVSSWERRIRPDRHLPLQRVRTQPARH